MLQHLLFQSTLWKGHLEQMFLSILIWCGNIECPCIENTTLKRILNSFSRPPLVQNSNISVTLFCHRFENLLFLMIDNGKRIVPDFHRGEKAFAPSFSIENNIVRKKISKVALKYSPCFCNNQLLGRPVCNHRSVRAQLSSMGNCTKLVGKEGKETLSRVILLQYFRFLQKSNLHFYFSCF